MNIERNGLETCDFYFLYTFYGCFSLATAPVIPALPNGVTDASQYLYYAFAFCTSLTTVPAIPALPNGVTSADSYLYQTFVDCALLTNALISNIPPFTGTGITTVPINCTNGYAAGTCPATPDRPISTLAEFKAGYNYH